MTTKSFALAGVLAVSVSTFAADYTVHTWKKIQLSDQFWSEGAAIGDFNKDGKMDVVSGPYWWAGPDFKARYEFMPTTRKIENFTAPFKLGPISKITIPGFEGGLGQNNAYSDNFFAFTHDFNKDGWDDVLIYGFPGRDASWYENPKTAATRKARARSKKSPLDAAQSLRRSGQRIAAMGRHHGRWQAGDHLQFRRHVRLRLAGLERRHQAVDVDRRDAEGWLAKIHARPGLRRRERRRQSRPARSQSVVGTNLERRMDEARDEFRARAARRCMPTM